MNGPQHYAEAERLLAAATETTDELEGKHLRRDEIAGWDVVLANLGARAQVHATLALVAAQVDARWSDMAEINSTEDMDEWGKAVASS